MSVLVWCNRWCKRRFRLDVAAAAAVVAVVLVHARGVCYESGRLLVPSSRQGDLLGGKQSRSHRVIARVRCQAGTVGLLVLPYGAD